MNHRSTTARLLIALLLALSSGCATESKQGVNTNDWGPAYIPGMENGPPQANQVKAEMKAGAFLAQQHFAHLYAKRACVISPRDGSTDVYFSLLSDKTGKTRGIVEVNEETGECSWLGNKE